MNGEELTNIQERLDAHRDLPLIKRIGARLLRHYPSSSEREAMRRAGLSTSEIIKEDIGTITNYSAQGNFLGRRIKIADTKKPGEKLVASLAFRSRKTPLTVETLNALQAHDHTSVDKRLTVLPEFAGVYTPSDSAEDDVIGGLYYFGKPGQEQIEQIELTTGSIASLPPQELDSLQGFMNELYTVSLHRVLLNPLS